MTLDEIKEKNKNLIFLTLGSQSKLFRKLNVDISDIIKISVKLVPKKENSYIAADAEAKTLKSVADISVEVFAEYPVQAGWCFGGNRYMNGMEWHKSSEVIAACTDLVLLLGDYSDITGETYESRKAIALYLKKGETVELMPMTLHLAPLPVGEFFIASVILPESTNLPLKSGVCGMRRAVNKWLLVHKDNEKGVAAGGKIGIVGENIFLNS